MHRYRSSLRTDGAARAEPNGLPLELCRVATEEGKAKYSKQFALNKQAQKVKYVATDIVAEEPETPSGGGDNNGGGGDNTPGGELEG